MEDLQKEIDFVKRTHVDYLVKLISITISLIIVAFGCAYLFAVSNFILLKFFSVGWFALAIYGYVDEGRRMVRMINLGRATLSLVRTFEQITQENKPLK